MPRWAEYGELATLSFILWMGLAAWHVPLTLVLKAHGLASIQPYAFATGALAAFVSPLIFGAVADRHMSAARVLRWLSVASALAVTLASAAIEFGWNRWVVLGLIQLYSLCIAPAGSLSATIVLERLSDPKRQYGPIRAMGTIGWMAGCWLISGLGADSSTLAGFSGAILWLGLAAFTWLLPDVTPPASAQHLTLSQRLGLDALGLLKGDHRAVFITAALFTIPIAAFYPFTPLHLRELGFSSASAWMSLGQTTEIVAMFTLAGMLGRWRLKWILGGGLVFGVLRYVFCAFNSSHWLLVGIALHGCSYTFFFTTAQIYINDRVDPQWRARAQALLTLMVGGVGNLLGYIGTGWWYQVCQRPEGPAWPLFWSGMSAVVMAVLFYFLVAYHGIGHGLASAKPVEPEPEP